MSTIAKRRSVLRAALIARDGQTCRWCGCRLSGCTLNPDGAGGRCDLVNQDGLPFPTLDHVRPRYHGGKTELSNLVLACLPCNQRRGHHGSYPIADLC